MALREWAQKGFATYVDPVKVEVPHSTISPTPKVIDDANTLKCLFGIERIRLTEPKLRRDLVESGSGSSQKVYSCSDSRVYIAGQVIQESIKYNGFGRYISVFGNGGLAYVQISFYGTGLNALCINATLKDVRATVDGGTEGPNIFGGSNASVVQNSRGHEGNVQINVTRNLALGWHTVKLRVAADSFNLFGFEVIGTTEMTFTPGSIFSGPLKENLSAQTTTDYKAGISGAKGARVIKYIKDGVISQVVQEVDATQLTYPNADHSNEQVLKKFDFKTDFAGGRSDDIASTNTSNSARAYTTDDNSHGVYSPSLVVNGGHNKLAVASDFVFNFIGSGVDIVMACSSIPGVVSFWLDGVFHGDKSFLNTEDTTYQMFSGVPYGSHHVRVTKVSGGEPRFVSFTTWGPKSPIDSLPAGAVKLSEYNVVADFVLNTGVAVGNMATGVIRKSAMREWELVNNTDGSFDWQTVVNTGDPTGGRSETNRTGEAFIGFFGTGFDLKFFANSDRPNTVVLYLQDDGTDPRNTHNLDTTNFPTTTTRGAYGAVGVSFNTSGILKQSNGTGQFGCGCYVTGLPLGRYRLRILNQSAGGIVNFASLDVIQPTHVLQEEAEASKWLIGNSNVLDERNFTADPLLDLPLLEESVFPWECEMQGLNLPTAARKFPSFDEVYHNLSKNLISAFKGVQSDNWFGAGGYQCTQDNYYIVFGVFKVNNGAWSVGETAQLRLFINGSFYQEIQYASGVNATHSSVGPQMMWLVYLKEGDVVQLDVFQQSGGTIPMSGGQSKMTVIPARAKLKTIRDLIGEE